MSLQHGLHLAKFAFLQVASLLAKCLEVYLHRDFGFRYLWGKFGYPVLILMTTIILLLGIMINAPLQLISTLRDADRQLPSTQLPKTSGTELREKADQWVDETLDDLEEPYLLDEAVRRGTWYVALFYKFAVRSVTLPFLMFTFGFVMLAYLRQQEAVAEYLSDPEQAVPADYRGRSRLADVFPHIDDDTLTRFVEPGLCLCLSFLVWGHIPGSRLTLPSFDADPVLGHFLLVSSVMLFIKENWRAIAEKHAEEERQEHRKAAEKMTAERRGLNQDRPIVRLAVEPDDESLSVADAFSRLSPHLQSLLSDLPEIARKPVPVVQPAAVPDTGWPEPESRPDHPGQPSDSDPVPSGFWDTPSPFPRPTRFACPHCRARLKATPRMPKVGRCPQCGGQVRKPQPQHRHSNN